MNPPASLRAKATSFGLFLFALGAAFYCYEYFLRIAPSVMDHQLMKAFSINATLFGGLSAFYLYAYTPLQLVVGMVVDRFRMRHILPLAVILCAGGSACLALSHSLEIASAGRFLQGAGSAFAFVGMIKLVSLWLPKERFAFFVGLGAMLGFLGAAFGETALGEFVEVIGWRETLIIFSIMGAALAAAFALALYSPKGRVNAQGSGHHVQCLGDCLSQLGEVVRHPRVWVAGVVSMLMFLPTSVLAELWGVPYFQKFHGYSLAQAAVTDSMIFIGWAIGAPLSGYISDRLGKRLLVLRVGGVLALGLILTALYAQGLPFALLAAILILFGAVSAVQTVTFAMARDVSSRSAVGTSAAFVNMLAMLGGMIFQRRVGAFLDMGWSGQTLDGVRVYAVSDYQRALLVVPACLALAVLICLFTREAPPRAAVSAAAPGSKS